MKIRSHILSPSVVRGIIAVCAVVATSAASTTLAAGVVGTGSAASCSDPALETALAGGGVVTFACGPGPVTIDISTGTGTKIIAADTTFDGGGLITISGGNSVRVFSVNAGINFTVQNLTIANGKTTGGGGGGGILNNGSLTVTNSTVSNSEAKPAFGGGGSGGGISNVGTLTVTNSTFSGNSTATAGGGIVNAVDGTLTVINSTFSGNSASGFGYGGGIANFGTVTVTNSTFSDNSASNAGGGIYNNGGTVTNCTFSGNSAAPGKGGGIANVGTLTVTNTIVANSTSGGNCAGSVTDGGHNLDDGTTCGFTGTGCTGTSGSSFCSTNPQLDPAGLANNGGTTQTIALEPESPAINAGDETICAAPPVKHLDQRGAIRPGTGAANCSIGAYEYSSVNPPAHTATPTATPTRTLMPSHTPTSTPTATPNAGGGGGGGCAIAPTGSGSAGWWLLVGALVLARPRRTARGS